MEILNRVFILQNATILYIEKHAWKRPIVLGDLD